MKPHLHLVRLALAILLALPGSALLAQGNGPSIEPATPVASSTRTHVGRQAIRVELVDEQGRPQPLPLVAGVASAEIASAQRYALRLTNLTTGRLSVLLSLDDQDPARGRRAYLGQPGLVLQPGEVRLLRQAKRDPRRPASPFLPGAQDRGEVALQVFLERTDYPTQMPGVPQAPYGPENFRVSQSGAREWIPPADYPFRKRSADPIESLYFTYRVSASLPAAAP